MEHWKNLSLDPLSEIHEDVLFIEEWKEIEGYNGVYQVSSFGRIKSLGFNNHPEAIKAQRFPKNGYLLVSLWKANKEKKPLVHRLVARAFIKNPENKKTVNHKKGIKIDNRFHQLEWNTQSENSLHSYSELGRVVKGIKGKDNSRAKAVIQYDKMGTQLAHFDTVTEAAQSVLTTPTHISAACRGKYKLVRGFKWSYA